MNVVQAAADAVREEEEAVVAAAIFSRETEVDPEMVAAAAEAEAAGAEVAAKAAEAEAAAEAAKAEVETAAKAAAEAEQAVAVTRIQAVQRGRRTREAQTQASTEKALQFEELIETELEVDDEPQPEPEMSLSRSPVSMARRSAAEVEAAALRRRVTELEAALAKEKKAQGRLARDTRPRADNAHAAATRIQRMERGRQQRLSDRSPPVVAPATASSGNKAATKKSEDARKERPPWRREFRASLAILDSAATSIQKVFRGNWSRGGGEQQPSPEAGEDGSAAVERAPRVISQTGHVNPGVRRKKRRERQPPRSRAEEPPPETIYKRLMDRTTHKRVQTVLQQAVVPVRAFDLFAAVVCLCAVWAQTSLTCMLCCTCI